MAEVKFSKKDNGLEATLSISLGKSDYQPAVEKQLKKYQQRVVVPGFRPGKAPMGLVKKDYGKSIYVEEVNRLVSEQLFGYLNDNNINYLAQPLMSETENSKVNFDVEEDFLFHFELGLAPDFELNLDKNDVLTRYKIKVTDAAIEKEIANIRRRYAERTQAESVAENDVVYAMATELNENGEPLEGGINEKRISLTPNLIKDDATKQQLVGAKVGDELKVNIKTLFNDNATVISNTLGITKEAAEDLFENFSLKIDEINHWVDAEINQELWNRIYGEGVVTTEEAFRQRVSADLENYYSQEAEHQLEHEISHVISDKHHFALPEGFLKRWLIETYPDRYTQENINQVFDRERNSFIYTLVQQKMQKEYELNIDEQEINNAAFGYVYNMFMQYGMYNITPDQVNDFAKKELQKEDFRRQMHDIALNRQIIQKVKDLVQIQEEEISEEDFYATLKQHNEQHHAEQA